MTPSHVDVIIFVVNVVVDIVFEIVMIKAIVVIDIVVMFMINVVECIDGVGIVGYEVWCLELLSRKLSMINHTGRHIGRRINYSSIRRSQNHLPLRYRFIWFGSYVLLKLFHDF